MHRLRRPRERTPKEHREGRDKIQCGPDGTERRVFLRFYRYICFSERIPSDGTERNPDRTHGGNIRPILNKNEMDITEIREFCLSLPETEETLPFDETTLVYKVGGKMFLLTDMTDRGWINVKCDPDLAIELRERHPEEVTPGYHMNQRHWNTVRTDGDLPEKPIRRWIEDSYRLVAESLPKAKRPRPTTEGQEQERKDRR